MANNLHFVTKLRDALASEDPSRLARTMADLERLGKEPDNVQAFRQYRRFLEIAQSGFTISISNNNQLIEQLPLSSLKSAQLYGPITPGPCSIQTSSGWLIWEEELSAQDLIWEIAFEQDDLPLAAEGISSSPKPTRVISVSSFEIAIVPGLESGYLRLNLQH